MRQHYDKERTTNIIDDEIISWGGSTRQWSSVVAIPYIATQE